MDGVAANSVATDNSTVGGGVAARRTAKWQAAAQGTEGCVGKGRVGGGNARDNGATVAGAWDADRPEHDCAGNAIAWGIGKGEAARKTD